MTGGRAAGCIGGVVGAPAPATLGIPEGGGCRPPPSIATANWGSLAARSASLAAIREDAAIGKRITSHGLRHTFASHLVMRGASLKAVQELLGHESIEMTLRYSHLTPDVKREAVRLLDRQETAGDIQETERREDPPPADRGVRWSGKRDLKFFDGQTLTMRQPTPFRRFARREAPLDPRAPSPCVPARPRSSPSVQETYGRRGAYPQGPRMGA